MQKNEVINLHQLETTPDLVFEEIVSHLDPNSLIKLCSTSKNISERCGYLWKRWYKRDISSKTPPCKKVDWRKLYTLTVSKTLPIYEIELYYYNGESDLVPLEQMEEMEGPRYSEIAIGMKQVDSDLDIVLFDYAYVPEDKLQEYIDELKEKGDIFIEPEDFEDYEEYEEADSYHLYLNYLGEISIPDLFEVDTKSNNKLYKIDISTKGITEHYAAIGTRKLEETIKDALTRLNITDKEMYPLIEEIKKSGGDIAFVPPYRIISRNKITNIQVLPYTLDKANLKMAIKRVCKKIR